MPYVSQRSYQRIRPDALKALPKKRSKYGAESCNYGGAKFHSRKEAAYAATLDILKKSKSPNERVSSWKGQVRVPLMVNGKTVCTWIVDFLVTYADGTEEWHEVKGYATDVYQLKRKLFEALYPERVLKVIR